MKWNDLTMSQRSDLMKLYLKHGITSLDSMRAHYNSFADGGKIPFKVWKDKMKAKYPDIEMENDRAGYDYESYFTNNYEDAIRQLSNLQHFPDTYKLPNHPTFSNESIYSRGPMMGGSWVNDTTFTPSVINRQYHPNIYREDRNYTEREIYNSYDTGGHLYEDGGPDDDKYSFLRRKPEVAVADNTRVQLNPSNLFEQQVQQAIVAEEARKAQEEFEQKQARRAKNEAESRAREAERRAKTPAMLREPTIGETAARLHPELVVTNPINTGTIYDKSKAELEEQAANWGRSVGSVATMTPEMVSRNPLTAVALGGLGEMAFLSGRYPFTNFRQTLSTASELLSPSTYTELLGASPVVGNIANTALGADIAYHSIQDLPEAAESFRLNNDLGSGLRTGLDLLGISPLYSMGKAGAGLVNDAANFARDFRFSVPKDANRYYRYVGDDAIQDYIKSGVIRSSAANPDFQRATVMVNGRPVQLGKTFDYNMFSKGKPWEGSLSSSKNTQGKKAKQLNILRSKENTGDIVWEESNKDFRHKGHAGIFRPNYNGDLNASPTEYFEWYEPLKIGYRKHEFPTTLEQAIQEAPEVLSAKEPFEMSDISNWREIFSNYNPNAARTVRTTTQSTEFNPDIFNFNKGNTDTRFEFFEPWNFINYDLTKMSTNEVVKTFGPEAKHLKEVYDVAAANNFEGKYADIAKDVELKLSKMFAIDSKDVDIAAGLARAKGIYNIPEYTERFKKYGDLGETFIQDAKNRLDNIQLQGVSRNFKITGQYGVKGGASTTPHPIHPTITLSNNNRSSVIREFITHEANHAAHGTKYQPKWMEVHNEKIRPVPKKNRKDFTDFDKYLDEMDELVERSKTAVEYAHETRLEGETLDQALDRVFEVANRDVYNSKIPSDIRQMVKNYTKDSVLKFWKQFLGGIALPTYISTRNEG